MLYNTKIIQGTKNRINIGTIVVEIFILILNREKVINFFFFKNIFDTSATIINPRIYNLYIVLYVVSACEGSALNRSAA